MKITRKWLMIFTAALGVLLIGYSLVRHFFGIGLSDGKEKILMDVIIFGALGLFMYNRKLAKNEKLAAEAAARAAEEAEQRAAEGEPEATDESLPHWERHKKSGEETPPDSV
ncbi:hypothetical protein AGMMS50230_11520 [Spirochaetia bacterium]|nr:hypothetical protein AGMMS50230_11520 [Spirochaetia bacterium]